MSDAEALAGFIDKWSERWPEWRVAEVFVPQQLRYNALAWFALQQELVEAAWGGNDPRPGEAKLAWWMEELQGWSQGRRRHPLGFALQRLPAPWQRLSAAIPSLIASREASGSREQAFDVLAPVADAMARVDATLFDAALAAGGNSQLLVAMQLQMQGDASVPLQLRARGAVGNDGSVARSWAEDILRTWPAPRVGPRPVRLRQALLHERLRRFAAGGAQIQGVPVLAALGVAWRAARG